MGPKCLTGALNNPVSRANYTGKSSNSLRINVDNTNMTISGDVIWSSALGEIANKAYPGDKGARNYAKIQELTSKLTNELNQANKFRTCTSTEIKQIARTAQLLQEALDEEIKRAQNEETELHTRITLEVDRSVKSDKSISKRLDEEIAARRAAGEELIQLMNSHTGEIVAETERAISAEQSLNEKINTVEDRLKLDDANLQSQISNLTTEMYENTLRPINTEGESHLYAVTGAYQHTIEVSANPVSGAVVRRDDYGNIVISEESLLEDNSAAPKRYVDEVAEDVKASLSDMLADVEFIDGGGAPR